MRIQVYRWEGRWKTQCDVNCYTYACFRKSKSYVDTRCFTVKTMETFHPDMSKYVKSCTRTHPRESKWCRVISWSVVVVSRSSWMVFIFYDGYAHVFTETYSWGKPRSMSGQMYGRWVEPVQLVTKLDRNRSRMSIITQLLIIIIFIIVIKCLLT